MKKILIFIAYIVFLSSCEDYLKEDVRSFVPTDDLYKTKLGYEGLVNASYSSLRDIYKGDPYIFCAGTDMYVEGKEIQPEGISEYQSLTSLEPTVKDFYFSCYKSIQLINAALYYNNPVTTIPQATLDQYQGELRFLRAFDYFLLVQTFGGVPVVKDYSKAPVQSFSRNSAQEVYQFIGDEMNAAMDLVPAAAALPNGRINKRIINHYLAKVHLTRGYEAFGTANDFTKAASYADVAINSQLLTIPFEDLFYPGKEKNAEVLFSIQYDATSILDPKAGGHRQNSHFGPYFGGEGSAVQYGYPYRSYVLCPTMYVYDLFTADDVRYDASFMFTVYGSFSGTKYIGRYYDYYDRSSDRKNLKIAYYYPPKWASSATNIAAWRAADPTNRTATIVIPYTTSIPGWEPSRQTNLNSACPAVKKFDDPKSEFSGNGSSTRDIYLARLGETYLIAAEAYFKSNKSDVAAQRINEVRKRAAKPGTNMAITSADVNIDFILDERGRELIGEYHRWFDLKRTGTLKERAIKYNKDVREWTASGGDPFKGIDGQDKILRPIPQAALDANNNKDFPQNPGY